MEDQTRTTEAALHRRMAVQLFNATWELLRKTERTQADTDAMIHGAHASRFHWEQAGTAENLIIGEWQISRVYAVLERPEPALYHAKRGLELCEANALHGFLRAYAYEALARAAALTQDAQTAHYLQKAYEIGEQIADAEDRQQLLDDLSRIAPETS